MAANESETTPPIEKGLTWGRCGLFVLLALGAGIALSWALLPVWLAPPYLAYTPQIHLLAMAAWLPVLIVCALRRPSGRWRTPVVLAVVGLFVSVAWCALIGPFMGGLTQEEGMSSSLACERESLPERRVRYTCTQGALLYTFEGREGWPFVRLVGRQVIGS